MASDVQLLAGMDDVADARAYRYDALFKVAGRINRVIFNLGDEGLTAEEQEVVQKALARARDEL